MLYRIDRFLQDVFDPTPDSFSIDAFLEESSLYAVSGVQTISLAGGIDGGAAVGEPIIAVAKPQPLPQPTSSGAPRTRRRAPSPYFIDRSRAQELGKPVVVTPRGIDSDDSVGTPALVMRISPSSVVGESAVGIPTVSYDYRRRDIIELLLLEAA